MIGASCGINLAFLFLPHLRPLSFGAEKLGSPTASAGVSSSCSSPSPQPVAPEPDIPAEPPQLSPNAGFPSIPLRKSPMVEQAVQTGPLESQAQKKVQQAKGAPVNQRGIRQSGPQSQPAPLNVPPAAAPVLGTVNDENRRPPRRRSGNRRTRNRSRGQNRPTTVKENAIKFEGDFDFETANAQFNREELDKEFKDKLNFKDEKPEKEGEEKTDSGVETQNSDGNPEEDPLGPNIYYDRSKSFFDNISSEMKSRRTTWAEERKLNTETFGVSGRFLRGRSFRGGFRGGRGSATPRRNQTTQRAGTGRV
ncbi:hypothetical protein XENTR_v10003482 [Xenopus tropicalis]|nr:hypothetical protein XENTR_v10003482 [Xenopus tropicalis]